MSTKDLQDSAERKTWIICRYCWSAWSVHHIGERCDCGEYIWSSEDEEEEYLWSDEEELKGGEE